MKWLSLAALLTMLSLIGFTCTQQPPINDVEYGWIDGRCVDTGEPGRCIPPVP
jgi:hypothetical protein